MVELKGYQEQAVNELLRKVNKLLELPDNGICVFKSPTGSGKTLMMAEFLKQLVTHRNDQRELAFIWISVNQLHGQSKEKLEKYFESTQIIKCSNFEDLNDRRIDVNEVLFFNWQSINKEDNIYIRENEQENNLSTIIENTRGDGREVVLVIDESHHTARSEKSQELIKLIDPKVTVEVSATPEIKDFSEFVNVDFSQVIADEMIKKEIYINPDIDDQVIGSNSTEEFVLKCAKKKREELSKFYKKEGSNINPLVLIQLPDEKKGVLDRLEEIISILKKMGVTLENHKLAIYLSDKDNKVNLENIEKSDNEVEFLIFKQAIAIGWDCPRAHILVLFRDWKSLTFSIQTVGRIMRMPEFKHYGNDELNVGYVFTNLANVQIAQDVAKDYLAIHKAKRKNDLYNNLGIQSIHFKRQREKTRLSGAFSKIFAELAKKNRLSTQLNFKPTKLVNELIVDGKIRKLDQVQIVISGGKLQVKVSDLELQYRFDLFLRSAVTPYAPARSMDIIKNAIYRFFESLKLDETEAQKIILSEENNRKFVDLINESKEQYQKEIVETLSEQRELSHYVWDVPEFVMYNDKYKIIERKKAIMAPYYSLSESIPERDFIELLEKGKTVKWWFKNGQSEDPKYFAVPYKDETGVQHGFYVDFIVQFNDGRIGLFDTKAGRTAKEAGPRSDGLSKYIKQQKNKKIFGGIVVFKDGSCRYFDGEKYSFDEKKLDTNWKFMTF